MTAIRTTVVTIAAVVAAFSGSCARSAAPSEPSAPPSGSIAAVVAKFELLTIGGQTLPLTFSLGGQSSTITGGTFVFYGDGTCTSELTGYGVQQCSYKLTGDLDGTASLVFFDNSGRGYFATGEIAAGVLTVNWLESETDVYRRAQ